MACAPRSAMRSLSAGRSQGLIEADEGLSTVDILEGLTAVVAVRLESPRFDSQTKRRLANPEAERLVHDAVLSSLNEQLAADPQVADRIVRRAIDAGRARLAARLASRTARYEQRERVVDYEPYRRQFGIRSKDWHDSCSWLTDEGLLRAHAELCDVSADARLLDVCCGSGVVGGVFADRVGSTVGLDITPEMVDLASQRLDRVEKGSVYAIPFADESYDIVVTR